LKLSKSREISDYLGKYEDVIVEHGGYFATNKRLIYFSNGEFEDVLYKEIASIKLVRTTYAKLGVLLLMIGFVTAVMGSWWSVMLLASGVLFFFVERDFYEVYIKGRDEPWLIREVSEKPAIELVRTIRGEGMKDARGKIIECTACNASCSSFDYFCSSCGKLLKKERPKVELGIFMSQDEKIRIVKEQVFNLIVGLDYGLGVTTNRIENHLVTVPEYLSEAIDELIDEGRIREIKKGRFKAVES